MLASPPNASPQGSSVNVFLGKVQNTPRGNDSSKTIRRCSLHAHHKVYKQSASILQQPVHFQIQPLWGKIPAGNQGPPFHHPVII